MESRDNLAHDLHELLGIEAEMRGDIVGLASPKSYVMTDVEDKLKHWLKKVQEIATKYRPKDYTITLSLGWPPGIQASFTWSSEMESSVKKNILM